MWENSDCGRDKPVHPEGLRSFLSVSASSVPAAKPRLAAKERVFAVREDYGKDTFVVSEVCKRI